MGYRNGAVLLPPELVKQIQEYVDGECVYIPRRRREPHPKGGRADALESRNAEIWRRYKSGVSVRRLSEEYYLSTQGIYKIIAKYRD